MEVGGSGQGLGERSLVWEQLWLVLVLVLVLPQTGQENETGADLPSPGQTCQGKPCLSALEHSCP